MTAGWLAELGVHDVAGLRQHDPIALWVRLKALRPRAVSLNMLWMLLALQQQDRPHRLPADLRAQAKGLALAAWARHLAGEAWKGKSG